jgi:hypothetical protein
MLLDQRFEMNGKAYATDAETLDVLRGIVPAAKETGDGSAVIALMTAGEMSGRVREVAIKVSARLVKINDPGHGWLKVPLVDLAVVGCEKEITLYSFYDDKYAYLEEDQDMGTYLDALDRLGQKRPAITEKNVQHFNRDGGRIPQIEQLAPGYWDLLRAYAQKEGV